MKLGKRSKDLSGERFGSLIAIEPHHKKNRQVYWLFKCDCGNTHVARGNIVSYEAKQNDPDLPSCGCVELKRKTKHGYRTANNTHPTYRIYRSMVNRCYNSNVPGYRWYGAKGVTVCQEWLNHPEVFCTWAIKNGWQPKLHIDKDILCDQLQIYPHLYSPQTCQWVSPITNIGYATSRRNYGKHLNIKLSQADAEAIIQLFLTYRIRNISELARIFNVKSPSTISNILARVR